MKKIYLITALVISFLTQSIIVAQESRLPSKEELKIKSELEKKYKTSGYALRVPGNSHLFTTGPEQNCNNAIPVCQQSYTQSTSYTGYGTQQEVSGTCLTTQETNSVWYTFTVQNSGTFTFLLNTANDYDFALYDITTIGCAGVPGATPVRCNFSATYGSTGLTLPTNASNNLSVPASGAPTMPGVNVTAGQTFALIIDNYSANTNGYTLTFGGTASIFDQTPPSISSINAPCNVGTITVNLSEPIRCNTIATDGSDFIITGPGGISIPVTAAAGNCSGGAGFTNQLTITYNNAVMPTGTYTLSTATGSDSNTLQDNCGNTMGTGLQFTFVHLGPLTIAATSTAVCAGGSSTITVDGAAGMGTYVWSPVSGNDSFLVVTPSVSTNYNVVVSVGTCTASITQSVSITNPPVVVVNPANVSLCSGTTNVTASATINGAICTNCDFTWSGSVTQTDLNTANSTLTGVSTGTYSVQVTSNTGCVGNTAVSQVNIATPSPIPGCNIIYVSPTGGGDGMTKANPTDIISAVSMAQCNSVVIKMQIGDYTINAPLTVSSLMTIEGGYNVGFTQKTSAKGTSGGFPVQGTRILRSTTSPEGTAPNRRLTAISVNASSSYFRLQDLIVEVSDPASGSKISTYAVYLGSGCSNYDIVRCYIDAGTGANGGAGVNGTSGTPGGNGGNGDQIAFAGGYGDGGTSAVPGQMGGAGGPGNDGSNVIYIDNNGNGIYDAGVDTRINDADFDGCDGFGPGATTIANANAGGDGGNEYTSESNAGGCDNPGAPYDGSNASISGVNGVNGVNGSNGSASGYAGGYFVIGGDGTNGTNGTDGTGGYGGGGGGYQNVFFDGWGGGGGGGGGAGEHGTAGTGATAGGGSFGIFSVAKGAASNVVDCYILATGGAGGSGGSGGTGGTGGIGGQGVVNDCDAGEGGDGTNGGNGGSGGSGGNADPGQSCLVCDLNGAVLTTIAHTNLDLANQAVITADNVACVASDIDYTASSGNPSWTNFGSNSNPTSGSGTPFNNVQYTATGYQTISLNSDVSVTVPAVLTGAAQNVSNTATSAAISGASACPTPINNNIVVSGYPASTSMNASGITATISLGSHSWFSDLSIFLIAPSGQILGLTNNRGNGAACTLNNITFSDAGGAVMGATCPAAGSTFRPETATYGDCGTNSTITTFGALGGAMNPNGTWTLRIVDNANGDGGAAIAVSGWRLNFPTYSYNGTTVNVVNQNDNYTDFMNIITNAPSPGTILASATTICPDTASFTASAAGSQGYSFGWTVSPSTGVTILDSDSSYTGIVLPNATSSPITYTVTLQVATECCGNLTPLTQTVLVNPFPANPTISDTTVCTGGTGILTATAPSGASFDWYTAASGGSPINSGTTFSVSPVNSNQTYYLETIDATGCPGARIPVNLNVSPVSPPTAIDVTACDTGNIQVGATPVSGAATYNWYADASGTTLLQSGSSLVYGVDVLTVGGSVTVYVADSVPGCNMSVLIPVVASVTNNPLTASSTYTANDTVCAGTNVTISVTPSGGSGSYTYLWSPNGETTDSINITPATVSTAYSVIIDDGTCSRFVATPLIVGSGATPPTVFGVNSICEGDSIYLYVNSVDSATYTWSGPAGTTIVTTDTTALVYPALASDGGSYSVVVTDTSGCPISSSPYNIAVNTAPSVTANSPTICEGTTTSITANGADTYTWSAGATSTGVNTADVNPTSTSSYTVTGTVTASGCADTSVFTVTVNNLPVVAAADASICLGDSAIITAGGADTYVWSTTSTTDTIIVIGSAVGTYTYSVIGTNSTTNCVSLSDTATVTVNALPNVAATASSLSICTGQSTLLTGTGAVTYTWSNSATSDTTTVSPTSTTVYTVTGANGSCSDTAQITVIVNTPPSVTASGTTICSGSTASITANGADTYVWSAGATSTGANTADVNPTGTTSYTVTGTTTSTGCTDTAVFMVNVNSLPVVSAANASVCTGITATLTATGATTYVWNTGSTTDTIQVTPAVAGTTTYTVVGTDTVTGCVSSQVIASITATALPVVNAVASNSIICSGASTLLTASGATTYLWNNLIMTDTNTVAPITTSVYSVTGFDNGCSSSTSVTVTVNPTPSIANSTTVNSTCNLNNGSITPTVSGGTPSYTYTWVNLVSGNVIDNVLVLDSVGLGAYQLTVTDANGCTTTSGTLPVIDGGSVNAQFATNTSGGVVPVDVTFTNNSTGANGYSWNFGNGSTSSSQNPATQTYSAAGTYSVILVATNGTCFDTAYAVIIVDEPTSIIIPNIFSPNGDGVNDIFGIVTTGMKTLEVDIFNRWGQKVAVISGIGQSWDGKLSNGDNASEGTYFYMLTAEGIDGVTYERHGSMMLVK